MSISCEKQTPQQNQRNYFSYSRIHNLRNSLCIRNEGSKTQANSQLPYLSMQNKYMKNEDKLISLSNRHLHYLFHQFCKQSYIGGANATFDDIAKSAQVMTLNKWMVFCNEFKLTEKINHREAVLIFKTVTNQRPQMQIQQFYQALKIFQQKTKISENQLGKKLLHVDSHSAARNRLCDMKVGFSGPKVNYFIQSRLTQKQRIQEKQALIHKKPSRQIGVILHQGMHKQHIQLSLLERKIKRIEKTENLRNKSAIYDDYQLAQNKKMEQSMLLRDIRNSSKKSFIASIKQHKTKSKSVFDNYSKIFKTKIINKNDINNPQDSNHQTTTSKNHHGSSTTSTQSQSRLRYEKLKTKPNDPISREPAYLDEENQKINEKQSINLDDSDTQSDEILKNHYENEMKARKINQKGLRSEMEERDTDLMITRYN